MNTDTPKTKAEKCAILAVDAAARGDFAAMAKHALLAALAEVEQSALDKLHPPGPETQADRDAARARTVKILESLGHPVPREHGGTAA